MREYQTKRSREHMPNAVYMKTIYQIRDYYRLVENLQDSLDAQPDPSQPHVKGGTPGSSTESKAMKRERDRDIVAAIDKALEQIPEEYRKGVWQAVMYGSPYPDDAATNTYSRYKADFIAYAAVKLGFL